MVPVARVIAAVALTSAVPQIAVAADPSPTCLAAATRLLPFVVEEAKGTRHEAQIAASIAEKGEAAVRVGLTTLFSPDQCAVLLIAPDSTIRALAIASLPERNGK